MEEWRALALTVPASLLQVAGSTRVGLLRTIDSAQGKLAACIFVLRTLRMGIAINANDVQVAPLRGVRARTILDNARRELVGVRELHDMAVHVFVLYGTRLGLHNDPLWQRWEDRSADAFNHASEALQRLRSADSHARASRDAVRMAQSFPDLSPGQNAWLSAALNLSRRAIRAATMATVAARRMRRAVAQEFFDALMVLNL